MNQILVVSQKKVNPFYKVQLVFSLVSIIIFIFTFLIHKYNLEKKEKYSEKLLTDYSISQLYSESNYISQISEPSDIIGIIEIPKINISYPIFYGLTDELLKISPCRFYGTMPESNSNLCIAGHNYENNKFFSNLNKLEVNDEIYLYDNNMKKYKYIVYDIFEVNENDWSSVINNIEKNSKLTLMTCNNQNKRRLIVKANYQNL